MSVVHIATRITRDQQAFEQNSTSDKSLLWLSNNATAEAFSIDLTVGEQWSEKYGPTSNEMHKIADDGMQILRHGSVVVTAAENIRVPHNMYGVLVPTGSLFLDKGILIAPAKVEPSFSGYLKLRLFNTTALKYCLKKGDKLGSVIFFSTETTKFQKPVTKDSVLVNKPIKVNQRISYWLKQNYPQLIGGTLSFLGSSLMAAIVIHFIFQPYFPNNPIPDTPKTSSPSESPSQNKP